MTPLRRALAMGRSLLLDPVPRDHRQSDHDFHRRRIVAAVTLLCGTTLLGTSLHLRPGNPWFYVLTVLLAVCWAVGSVLSGPLHLGYLRLGAGDDLARPSVQPFLIGLAAIAVFVLGALVVAHIGPLNGLVQAVLSHAPSGSVPVVLVITVINGIAEELFFRGALYAAIGVRRPVIVSTVVYTLVTLGSGNVMLAFAALVLGLLVALQRRVTGGILAPIITHVTWSAGMLLLLPLVLR